LANGVEHLPPPGAFASRRRGAGERVEHRDGSEQRAEILERNFDARDLAQKAVDVMRARLAAARRLRCDIERGGGRAIA
jgi:hypothetical protein